MKHVLITGGSDGLGKVTASKLLKVGFLVTILGPNEAKTKAVSEKLNSAYVVADVTDYDQVAAAMERAIQASGPIEILINNAGVWLQDSLEANSPEDIRKVIEVNTLGVIFCTRAIIGPMKQRMNGRIINVISQAGFTAKAERATYGASKWAATGFTKCMQAELKQFNISVDGFFPGAMDSGIFNKAGNERDMSKALDLSVAAEALEYICKLPDGVGVPEMGLLSLGY